ncbi:MAG: hypothetical protein LR015_11760 [Verrucomicrobia bacterium]|nr:hypothetical protein [Verrucomicrobiota bacterium]
MSADASLYWNATIGLFRKPGPGHTAPVAEAPAVHSLPETFIRFAIDAQLGCLELDKFDRALDALAAVQVRDPQHPLYGCLRWYYEEEEPIDTNASFFTGLTLLVVEYCQRSAMPDDIRDKLQVIFQGLFHWFTKELAESKLHYPNKHLGDLVCAWLLAEYLADEDALRHLEVQFAQAETYWKATHWGWGEHLSQVYTTVMLTEISVLLVMQKRLPKALFDALRAMADELLVLQDYFGSNAWVPPFVVMPLLNCQQRLITGLRCAHGMQLRMRTICALCLPCDSCECVSVNSFMTTDGTSCFRFPDTPRIAR